MNVAAVLFSFLCSFFHSRYVSIFDMYKCALNALVLMVIVLLGENMFDFEVHFTENDCPGTTVKIKMYVHHRQLREKENSVFVSARRIHKNVNA